MKKFQIIPIIVTILICTSAHSQELADVSTYINAIKMNPEMLYGEATCMTEIEARAQALSELKLEFEKYSSSHDKTHLDSSKVEYLKTMRGNNTRILAYIHLDSLVIEKPLTKFNLKWIEKDLIRTNTLEEVISMIKNKPYASSLSIGTVNLSTLEEVIKNSYLLVLRGPEKLIVNIYSPCYDKKIRTEIKSGHIGTAIDLNKGDSVIWLGSKY